MLSSADHVWELDVWHQNHLQPCLGERQTPKAQPAHDEQSEKIRKLCVVNRRTYRPRQTTYLPTNMLRHAKGDLPLCMHDCPEHEHTKTTATTKTWLVNMSGLCVTADHKEAHIKPPQKHLHTEAPHSSPMCLTTYLSCKEEVTSLTSTEKNVIFYTALQENPSGCFWSSRSIVIELFRCGCDCMFYWQDQCSCSLNHTEQPTYSEAY